MKNRLPRCEGLCGAPCEHIGCFVATDRFDIGGIRSASFHCLCARHLRAVYRIRPAPGHQPLEYRIVSNWRTAQQERIA
jgi:hypothetical protein